MGSLFDPLRTASLTSLHVRHRRRTDETLEAKQSGALDPRAIPRPSGFQRGGNRSGL